MAKPKVERGWMAWSKKRGYFDQMFHKEFNCEYILGADGADYDEIRYVQRYTSVIIRPITKKGVRRGK